MKKQTRKIALGALFTALGVTLMLLGAAIGIGTYAAPMLAGLLLLPLGARYGTKYQLTVFAATALLSLLLVAEAELKLMYLGFFGWYPAVHPFLERQRSIVRVVAKFSLFNAAVIAAEALALFVFAPEVPGGGFLLLLLALGNVVFFLYDRAIPRLAQMGTRYLRRLFPAV